MQRETTSPITLQVVPLQSPPQPPFPGLHSCVVGSRHHGPALLVSHPYLPYLTIQLDTPSRTRTFAIPIAPLLLQLAQLPD